MQIVNSKPTQARHARLFELIRQQDIAAACSAKSTQHTDDLNDAQRFIEAASNTLKVAV
ncbi:hypothetical protein KO498_11395 [Lentibacter algarum]|uniref:hypothetical protein n=1 Tax=Lentibacter algarum TaxID=576131 RepID=UPI001C082655|nr:hypothetical protein [Lentibacter algarum]MBU2982413.1 hypothetical protein [Lentibacter algarum]